LRFTIGLLDVYDQNHKQETPVFKLLLFPAYGFDRKDQVLKRFRRT